MECLDCTMTIVWATGCVLLDLASECVDPLCFRGGRLAVAAATMLTMAVIFCNYVPVTASPPSVCPDHSIISLPSTSVPVTASFLCICHPSHLYLSYNISPFPPVSVTPLTFPLNVPYSIHSLPLHLSPLSPSL